MIGLSHDGVRKETTVDGTLVLVLDNTLDAIEGGRLRILRLLGPRALSARTINRLEVIFEELVSNVIRHGFTAEAERSILVTVGAGPDCIQLTVEDDGKPFNPFEVDAAPEFDSLETVRVGGLGIPVVRRFSTSATYEAGPASAAWSEMVAKGGRPINRVRVEIAAQA